MYFLKNAKIAYCYRFFHLLQWGHINESLAKWCVIPGLLGMSDKKWRPIAIGSAVISDLIPDGAQILCAVFSP